MKKSFLLVLNEEDHERILKATKNFNFVSTSSFLRYCISFTIDCLLCPDDASTHAKASLRHLRK